MASLVETLLLENGRTDASEAIRYEGPFALQSAFQRLGQVAAADLMSDREVASAIIGFSNHLDLMALEQAFGPMQ